MTREQVWAAILVAAVAVAVQLLRAGGNALEALMKARARKETVMLEGASTSIEAQTEAEKMGILYMQQLIKENENLRAENKLIAGSIATLTERVHAREEQLSTQSELKVEAIKRATASEKRALASESALISAQRARQECATRVADCDSRMAELLGKYNELHLDLEQRRKDWHDNINAWQALDSARQTEVQRARFIMRQLNSRLTEEQRDVIRAATATKGFNYDQFVEVAGSLEMAELEELHKENEELKRQLKDLSPVVLPAP